MVEIQTPPWGRGAGGPEAQGPGPEVGARDWGSGPGARNLKVKSNPNIPKILMNRLKSYADKFDSKPAPSAA